MAGPASYEWRFAVTKLNLRVLTFFDRLARDKKVTYTLNKAAIATGVVPSDDPEVYLVQSDGFPLLDEGVRCLLGFRREGGEPPWVCRFGGIIMQVEDNVDENSGVAPYSTFTAYDPRQLLYSRPIRKADGNHVGTDGLSFDATPGNEIALALLERTFAEDGEHFIDVDSGSIETTPAMDIDFQQGTSVGEAFDQLSDTGNLDIVLTALYDPVVTPNKLAVFNCSALAGTTRYKAAMAWDRPSRSLVGVNRLKDGTQRANRIRYTGGDGTVAGVESDFASAVQYGDYWTQQTFPGKNVEAVELLAAEQLLIRAKGVKTYKLSPVPGSLGQIDSPLVFLDYTLGDVLPIYASSRLRQEIAVGKRVTSIPINIADDGRERIEELELGEGEVEVGGGGGGGGGDETGDVWFCNNFEGDIESDITAAPFTLAYANAGGRPFSSTYFKSITGETGQGLGLQVDSAEAFDGGDLGPLTSLYVNYPDSHTTQGETTWYRVRFKIPSAAWVEGAGDFQWLLEWHENVTGGDSIALGLSNINPAAHPQLLFRPGGGDGASPTYEYWYSASALSTPLAMELDQWYELVAAITWDTIAGGSGSISLWLDGAAPPLRKFIASSDGDGPAWSNPHSFPTLYTDAITDAVDQPIFGIYNYRKPLSPGQSSRVDFDGLCWGPSAASIGFTP